MYMENPIIFFFSAIGAFNGFILSLYFAMTANTKIFSNYFLALLLFALSIRVTKSVFFYFVPDLANWYIQFGLSACIVIGPFLYLYLKSITTQSTVKWKVHILPFLLSIMVLGWIYPYSQFRSFWNPSVIEFILIVWLFYIIYSFKYIYPILNKLYKKRTIDSLNTWVLSIYFGVFIIWLAYTFGVFVSYIVGALSFSFVLYLVILLFVFRFNKKTLFFQAKPKYKDKKIKLNALNDVKYAIEVFKEKELFLRTNMTLDKASEELPISRHLLSQYLNENLGKSFNSFINQLRVQKAKELLRTKPNYTIESIGYESGFRSKSTFFTSFKKITGQTPSQYLKATKT